MCMQGFYELYEVGCDGGLWFLEKQQLALQEVVELVSSLSSNSNWQADLLPFARDADDALLVVKGSDRRVYDWQPDEGLGDVVADSLLEHLEHYRNDLLSMKFEFIEDIGVVEKAGK